jgi:membrane associated rhomboid family serine protease
VGKSGAGDGSGGAESTTATCYRHARRPAGVTCQRCGRPICPDCMVSASVGFHCPECVKASARTSPIYTARSLEPVPVTPYVTYALVAINVLVLLWDLTSGGSLFNANGIPYHRGFLAGPLIADGQWWRLVTSGFLHSSILHLGLNMLALVVVGTQLERAIGSLRFGAVYAGALLTGAFGALLLTPAASTVGASGAIFGVFGAAAVYQVLKGINVWRSGLAPLILINMIFTISVPSISIGGHLGGFIGGALIGFVMMRAEQRRQSPLVGVVFAALVGVISIVAAIALAPELIVYR